MSSAHLLSPAPDLKRRTLSIDKLYVTPKRKSFITRTVSQPIFLSAWLLLSALFIFNMLYIFPTGSNPVSTKESIGRKLMVLFAPHSLLNASVHQASNRSLGSPPIVRTKLLAFVGIMSYHKNGGRRTAVRNSWLPKRNESSNSTNGLVFKFIIGKSDSEDEEKSLQSEIELHRDILRLDHMEDYGALNRKTIAYFKLAFSLYDAEYYVKMDDDIYLIPVRLTSFLMRKRESPNVYWGCMVKGAVVKNPHMRWYEPNHPLLPDEYPLHAVGSLYGLSKSVTNNLIHDSSIERRMIFSEDVMIGFWMLLWNVNFENDWNLCSHSCTNESVAIWYAWGSCNGLCNPEGTLLSLHENPECRPAI